MVGFARVLVESERVEKSNLKKFFLFFFVSLVSLVFFFPHSTLFLTHYLLLEGESTKRTTPTHEGTLLKIECQKVRILPAFFFVRTTTKKQPTNSLGSPQITTSTTTRVYKTCEEEAQFSNATRDTRRVERNDHRSGVTIIDGSGETEAR